MNVSVVAGKLSAERAQAMSTRGRQMDATGGQPYSATSLSLVYHPAHPFVPTLRADVRQFQVSYASSGEELSMQEIPAEKFLVKSKLMINFANYAMVQTIRLSLRVEKGIHHATEICMKGYFKKQSCHTSAA